VVVKRLERAGEDRQGDPEIRTAHIGLNARTGRPRWCLRGRSPMDEEFYQADTRPDRIVIEEPGRASLVDPGTGRTVARIAVPPRDGTRRPAVVAGWDKLAVRQRSALWVYRLGDGKPLYHVPDLPHPRPRDGHDHVDAFFGRSMAGMILGPGGVVTESWTSDEVGIDKRFLVTAYDDAGRAMWRLPETEHPRIPRARNVFGDAVILESRGDGFQGAAGVDGFEARRLADGRRLWWAVDPNYLAGTPLTAGGSYLYGTTLGAVTAIDRTTGAGTPTLLPRLPYGEGRPALVRGSPNALAVTDRHTVAVFDLPR
jgi:PQQ-like domain